MHEHARTICKRAMRWSVIGSHIQHMQSRRSHPKCGNSHWLWSPPSPPMSSRVPHSPASKYFAFLGRCELITPTEDNDLGLRHLGLNLTTTITIFLVLQQQYYSESTGVKRRLYSIKKYEVIVKTYIYINMWYVNIIQYNIYYNTLYTKYLIFIHIYI